MEIGIAEILHYNKNTRKPNNEHVKSIPEIRIKIIMALTGNLFLFGSDNEQNKIC